jgi:hypothetical protein
MATRQPQCTPRFEIAPDLLSFPGAPMKTQILLLLTLILTIVASVEAQQTATPATQTPTANPQVPGPDTVWLSVLPNQQKVVLTATDLKQLPRKAVVAHNPHSNTDEKYEGVLLADLLTKYGAPLGKDLRGPALANYVVATGADGYKVVYSLAELDPTFHPGDVIIADTMDGKPLDAHTGPFRLVSTEDKRPARGVRNLVSIELKAAQ